MYITLLLTLLCASSGVLSNTVPAPCEVGNQSCLDVLANTLLPIVFGEIPEYGVESSDPLFIDEIKGNYSTLKYQFLNNTIVGYKKCIISNMLLNEDITEFRYDMTCPKISVTGKYDVSGQLLTIPVEGNGDYELVTGKYFIRLEADLEKAKLSDGEIYVFIKTFKLTLVPLSPMDFNIKNLYNGQKDLSDAFHKFLHENWRQAVEFVQEPVWYACLGKVIKNINKFLSHVPLRNLVNI